MKAADQSIKPGELIEEFRVVRILGAGNFGIVYQAENVHLDEMVAIKEFLPTELARREEDGQIRPLSPATAEAFRWARDRFLQEARTLWALGHPHPHPSIVRVTRYQEANGSAYMFMEFEYGQPLSELLDQRGSLTYEEVRPIIAPLLDGLERVHAANILHRDIKPANILIRPDGSPVFIDFGAARNVALSGETSVFTTFTPRYAALEQYDQSGKQGPWTDIYALGATLYHAVTGITPKSASEQLLGQPQEPAAILGHGRYPDAFLHAIDAACALRPEDRPQTVAAWRRLLFDAGLAETDATVLVAQVSAMDATRLSTVTMGAVTSGRQTLATSTAAPSTAQPVRGHKRASVLGWVALGVTVMALSGVSGWWWWTHGQPESPAEATKAQTVEAPAEPPTLPPVAATLTGPVASPPAQVTPESPAKEEISAPSEPLAVIAPEVPSPGKSVPAPKVIPSFKPAPPSSDTLKNGMPGPMMIDLPPGEFIMGSAPEEAGHHDDERAHLVRIAEPFAMSRNEIIINEFSRFTQAANYRTEAEQGIPCLRYNFDAVEPVPDPSLDWTSPGYDVGPLNPVVCVTWRDASAYTQWLSEQTGRTYRLPTEEEWEYAARAETSTSHYWDNDSTQPCRYANTADYTVREQIGDSLRRDVALAPCSDNSLYSATYWSYKPNEWGLRDMIGNVAEWTCSVYDSGYGGQCLDPSRYSGQTPIVVRGGSWLSSPDLSRSAAREQMMANVSSNTVGFRVVRIGATQQPVAGSPARD